MSITLHTSLGDIKCEIFPNAAPKAAENFLKLSASGYYDGTKFHRNIAGFMLQGGDPTGTGKGGESVFGGTFEDEFSANLRHNKRGVIAMANNGENTNASQFFILYEAQPHLDNVYTIFGQVIAGWDMLDAAEKAPVKGKKCRPVDDLVLQRVTIHFNPLA